MLAGASPMHCKAARVCAHIRLFHPFPSALVVGTSVVLLLIARGGWPGLSVLLRAAGTIALSQIAVGSLNDLHDRETDARFQPEKPIPSGLVSFQAARVMVGVSLAGVAVVAGSFGPLALLIALVGTGGGLAYDLWLKPTPFSIVGYSAGFLSLITFLWLVAGRLDAWFLLAYPAGVFVVLAAHLSQSFPDLESDTELGLRGLAVHLGSLGSLIVIFMVYTVVLLAGLAAATIAGSLPSLALVSASVPLSVLALLNGRAALIKRSARITMFHLMAPALALLGAGCLLAIRSL